MIDETAPTIPLDGATYAVRELTQAARDTLQSIRFVKAKLQQLQGKLAVVQIARALKSELKQLSPKDAK